VIQLAIGKAVQREVIAMPAADGGVFERSHLIARHDVTQKLADILSGNGVVFMHTGAHEDAACDHVHNWTA
jgi:hypothetical protein